MSDPDFTDPITRIKYELKCTRNAAHEVHSVTTNFNQIGFDDYVTKNNLATTRLSLIAAMIAARQEIFRDLRRWMDTGRLLGGDWQQ